MSANFRASDQFSNSFASQWVALVFSFLVLGAACAAGLYEDHNDIIAHEREHLDTQIKIVNNNLEHQIKDVRRMLMKVRGDLSSGRDIGREERLIKATGELEPRVDHITILDAQGKVLFSTKVGEIGRNNDLQEYFQTPRRIPNPDILYVNPPFRSANGLITMTVAISILGPEGQFNGVVAATLTPAYFETLLNSVRYAPDMWVTLNHGDGKSFMSYPVRPGLEDIEQVGATAIADNADDVKNFMVQKTFQPVILAMSKSLVITIARKPLVVYSIWRRNLFIKLALLVGMALSSIIGLFIYQKQVNIYNVARNRATAIILAGKECAETYLAIAGSMILALDSAGVILFANHKCCKILGYQEGDLLGRDWFATAIPEYQREDVRRVHGEIFSTGHDAGHTHFVNYVVTRNGESRLISWHNTVVHDKSGIIISTLSSGQDITERKLAEQALQQSEENYRTIFEAANDAFFIHRLEDGVVESVNSRMLDMYGYAKKEEVVGSFVDELSSGASPYTGAKAGELVQKVVNGQPQLFEWLAKRKNGELFWVEVNLKRVVIGGVDKLLAIVRDITERHKAEEALRKSEAELQGLFDGMTDLVILLDEEGRFLKVSDVSKKLLYRPGEELLGKTLHDIFPKNQADSFLEKLRQTAETNKPVILVYSLVINGEKLWFEGRISPLPDKRVVFVARDITEARKQVILLENVLSNIPCQVFWKDRNLTYLGCNKSFAEVVGLNDPSEIAGMSDYDFIRDATHADGYRAWDKKIMDDGQEVIGLEEPYSSANGNEGFVLTSKVPLRNEFGDVYGILGICTDITERRQAENQIKSDKRQLESQSRQLEAVNAELEQFAYVASHDLRAPLRTVTGFLNLVASKLGPEIDADTREYVGYAVDGAKQMDAMILALLDYSRTGKSGQPFEFLALAAVVQQSLHNLLVLIQEAKAEVEVAENLPTIEGERIELVRLFQNLIGNAVKYSHPDRTIKVSVGYRDDGAEWVVWVKDNGIGIAPNSLERIFQVFQRLVTQEEYEGSGIGLTVCKKIAEHHGGRIWVESVVGEGSTFLVAFPKALSS